MPLRKIAEPKKDKECHNPEHNPPMYIYLEGGTYEYTCPDCGKKITFNVPKVTW